MKNRGKKSQKKAAKTKKNNKDKSLLGGATLAWYCP